VRPYALHSCHQEDVPGSQLVWANTSAGLADFQLRRCCFDLDCCRACWLHARLLHPMQLHTVHTALMSCLLGASSENTEQHQQTGWWLSRSPAPGFSMIKVESFGKQTPSLDPVCMFLQCVTQCFWECCRSEGKALLRIPPCFIHINSTTITLEQHTRIPYATVLSRPAALCVTSERALLACSNSLSGVCAQHGGGGLWLPQAEAAGEQC
jgi:hypothetical protein